jgi:hypothetical protein
MFKNWFKKKVKEPAEPQHEPKIQDLIEESLWEIKEQYDLPTEEVVTMVELKRRNLMYMHKMISKKENYE